MTQVAENVTVAAKIREYVVERAAYRKYSHSPQTTTMEASWISMPANLMFVPMSGLSGGTLELALAARPPPVPWMAIWRSGRRRRRREVEARGDGAVALAVLGY